jgi:predicted nucleotidyltransferase
MNVSDVLGRMTTHLEQVGIAYMLVGSFASAFHGAMRSTQDIDLVIEASPEQLRNLIATLQREGYYAELDAAMDARRHESLFNVIHSASGWKIDLIFRKSRAFDQEEFRRRRPTKFFDIQLFVASAEDVVISKLEWSKIGGSQRQIEDVGKVLGAKWTTLDQNYLSKWIEELQLQEQWSAAKQAAEIAE